MNRIIRRKDRDPEKSDIAYHLGVQKSGLIDLSDVEKRYHPGNNNGGKEEKDAFTALSNINMALPLNTITVIKGPSGSGKTTLLSLIGCMARPTSGRIRFGGKEVTSLPERFLAGIRQAHFGFIFQNLNLIHDLNVLENTILPTIPTNQNPKRVKARAMEILESVKMVSKAHQKVRYLSGGEQQRVAIARALINEPQVIIADEPTAHLNTRLALEFLDIMAGLHAEGKTILIASHDPLLYDSEIIHQVVVLRDGRIVESTHRYHLIN